MSDKKSEEYVKYPTFDGKDESWPFYKKKMESYLARLDLSELLLPTTVIERDGVVNPDATAQAKIELLQKKNRKAAGALLSSIDDSTEKGKAAFFLIEKFHNVDDGYAGGYFRKEWDALTARFERIQVKNLRDQKTDYYTEKMGKTEQPSLFIVKMDRMRKDLKKLGYDVSDQDFVQDILGKLPESKDTEKMTAYEVEKKLIESKIVVNASGYTIEDLITDLEKVYQEKTKTKEISKAGEVGFYGETRKPGRVERGKNNGNKRFKKQFKGRCSNCGKIGHKAADCWSNEKKGDENKGSYQEKR